MKRNIGLIAMTALALAGCGVFKPAKKAGTPTLGERIPVLSYESRAEAEPELKDLAVVLPLAETNADWAQPGGSPAKVGGHLTLPDKTLRPAWTASIGKGSSSIARLNAAPVVMGDRVYTMDINGEVRAFDTATGREAWSRRITIQAKPPAVVAETAPPADPDQAKADAKAEKKAAKKSKNKTSRTAVFGGGVAGGDGRIFATTGFGIVVAFDAASGTELWRRTLPTPLRGAPTVAGNRLFALTQDNQLHALSTDRGEVMWTVSGTVEVAGLLGAGAPAVAQDTIVVGFSSGELNALRAENGRTVWSDQLARTGRATAMASLSDIDASPVIDRGRVFAIGHGGRMAALELATGQRLWERNFAGTSTPWIAGEFIYLTTLEGEVVCLTRADGKVRWVVRLPHFKNPKKKADPIFWSGPVLASEKLIVTGSNGMMTAISPYDGKEFPRIKLGAPVYLPPVVAGNTLYILADNGKLTAWR